MTVKIIKNTIKLLIIFCFCTVQNISHASSGLLVSLVVDVSIDGAVQVTLTSSVGATESVTLLDNGEKPDVAAGDKRYAGAMLLAPGEYDVKLALSDDTYEGNSFEMPEDGSQPRDLYLVLNNGTLSVSMGVANGGNQEASITLGAKIRVEIMVGIPIIANIPST